MYEHGNYKEKLHYLISDMKFERKLPNSNNIYELSIISTAPRTTECTTASEDIMDYTI